VNDPGRVVAGGGVIVRPLMPRPRTDNSGVTRGAEAIVVNVYTDHAYRRRGLARMVMHQIIDWAETSGIESLVLQASLDGRPLYEQLGFVASREMRFAGRP
jgi:GNAT superfamily N-acetyltransferase